MPGGRGGELGLRVSADVRNMVTSADGSHAVLTSQEFSSELWALDNLLSALK